MVPSWLVIGGVTFLVALVGNVLRPRDVKWFARLRRPQWLTFEMLIPLIWILCLSVEPGPLTLSGRKRKTGD